MQFLVLSFFLFKIFIISYNFLNFLYFFIKHFPNFLLFPNQLSSIFLQKKSLAILPYILFSLVISAILICHVTEVVLAAIQNSEEAAEDADWTHNQTLLVVLLYTAAAGLFIFCIYFIMCIYSLYEIIRFEEKRRKYFRSFDLMAVDKNLK